MFIAFSAVRSNLVSSKLSYFSLLSKFLDECAPKLFLSLTYFCVIVQTCSSK